MSFRPEERGVGRCATGGRGASRAGRAIVLLCLTLGLGGCTGVLWSTSTWRSGPERAARPVVGELPGTKAEVLARLGPPSEIRPLEGGDLFLYRLQRARREILDLNTAFLGVGGMSLYADIQGEVVDQVLYVRFDSAGRVLDFTATRPR
ncbi:MAG: hypothetical protein ACYTG2_07325 [Planctomycetota bacterium]|jgi:hypothetical protein